MNTYQLPGEPPHCPNCNKKQDGATGEDRMPETGDYCVCFYCATISRYEVTNGVYKLKQATEQDLNNAQEAGVLGQLYAIQDFVKLNNRL